MVWLELEDPLRLVCVLVISVSTMLGSDQAIPNL